MNQILKRIKAHAVAMKQTTSRKDSRYSKLQDIIDLCDDASALEVER